MNGRMLTVLTTIAGILAIGEFGSSIMIWQENYPGSLPQAAAVFGVFFLIATWLLRSGRVHGGRGIHRPSCACSRSSVFPAGRSTAPWTGATDTVFALVSLAGLIAAIIVLAARLRRRATA